MTNKQKQIAEEIKAKLIEQVNTGDKEEAHMAADKLLCELLDALGMADVVEVYNKIGKWYA